MQARAAHTQSPRAQGWTDIYESHEEGRTQVQQHAPPALLLLVAGAAACQRWHSRQPVAFCCEASAGLIWARSAESSRAGCQHKHGEFWRQQQKRVGSAPVHSAAPRGGSKQHSACSIRPKNVRMDFAAESARGEQVANSARRRTIAKKQNQDGKQSPCSRAAEVLRSRTRFCGRPNRGAPNPNAICYHACRGAKQSWPAALCGAAARLACWRALAWAPASMLKLPKQHDAPGRPGHLGAAAAPLRSRIGSRRRAARPLLPRGPSTGARQQRHARPSMHPALPGTEQEAQGKVSVAASILRLSTPQQCACRQQATRTVQNSRWCDATCRVHHRQHNTLCCTARPLITQPTAPPLVLLLLLTSQRLPPPQLLRLLIAAATQVQWNSSSCSPTSTTYNPSASSSGCGTSSNSSSSSACRRAASANFSCCRTSARPALLNSVSSPGPAMPCASCCSAVAASTYCKQQRNTTAGTGLSVRITTSKTPLTTLCLKFLKAVVLLLCTGPLPASTDPAGQLGDTETPQHCGPNISQHLPCNKATTSTLC